MAGRAASPKRRVAVIGGGWAGLACAVEATRRGHAVTLFESARVLGGRARAVDVPWAGAPSGSLRLDNGQHILIGAYSATLDLMRALGVDADASLHRMPLALRFPDGDGLAVPSLPPPLDLLVGIARARGWSWRDKASLVTTALRWRLGGFDAAPELTVDALCACVSPRVVRELLEPLCLSALNTPMATASASVFLRVLHDAMFAQRGGADLLLPRVHIGALLPDAAAHWLRERGAALRLGARVQKIEAAGGSNAWAVDGEVFDRVVLACSPWEAARLARSTGQESALQWARVADALRYEGIATVYAKSAQGLDAPLIALRATADMPAQFVFDRGRLDGPPGLLAFVVSASHGEREAIEQGVMRQAHEQLGLQAIEPVQTIVERRATFACTTKLVRPAVVVAPGLAACGDYIEGPYPSTLEGAVRSGLSIGTMT